VACRIFAEHILQEVAFSTERRCQVNQFGELSPETHKIIQVEMLRYQRLWPAIREAILNTTWIANIDELTSVVRAL